LSLVGGEVVPDPSATAGGRGAYLHRSPRCLEAALRARTLERILVRRRGAARRRTGATEGLAGGPGIELGRLEAAMREERQDA
jgi:hypothetical protein